MADRGVVCVTLGNLLRFIRRERWMDIFLHNIMIFTDRDIK